MPLRQRTGVTPRAREVRRLRRNERHLTRLLRQLLQLPRRTSMSTGSDVSILLVEDDECIRLVTTAVLRTIGYTNVSFAGNGEEAVRVCAEKLFDVILMDCEMPVMNGFDAALAIRSHEYRLMLQNTHSVYYSIPIVVVTGERHLVERLSV